MIKFYLKCHECGSIQFTILAVVTESNKALFNTVCVACGYESSTEVVNNKHTARKAEV